MKALTSTEKYVAQIYTVSEFDKLSWITVAPNIYILCCF